MSNWISNETPNSINIGSMQPGDDSRAGILFFNGINFDLFDDYAPYCTRRRSSSKLWNQWSIENERSRYNFSWNELTMRWDINNAAQQMKRSIDPLNIAWSDANSLREHWRIHHKFETIHFITFIQRISLIHSALRWKNDESKLTTKHKTELYTLGNDEWKLWNRINDKN